MSWRWTDDPELLSDRDGALSRVFAERPAGALFDEAEWIAACVVAPPVPGRVPWLIVDDGADGPSDARGVTWGTERLHGVPVRTWRLIGDPLADRATLPRPAERAISMLDRFAEAPRPWDVVVLAEIVATEDERRAAMDWARGRGYRGAWELCSRVPILPVGDSAAAADHGGPRRSLRTRIKRARQKLAEAGAVRFERATPDPDQVPALLAEMRRIEDASWKGPSGVGVFSSDERRALFGDFARRLAARGKLDVSFIKLDGRPISYRFGFRHGGAFLDFNLAYDPDYAALSPGRVLLDDIVRSSADAGLDAVDASRASLEDPHLLSEWTRASIEHHRLWIFAPSACGRALSLIRTRLRPWVRRMRGRSEPAERP